MYNMLFTSVVLFTGYSVTHRRCALGVTKSEKFRVKTFGATILLNNKKWTCIDGVTLTRDTHCVGQPLWLRNASIAVCIIIIVTTVRHIRVCFDTFFVCWLFICVHSFHSMHLFIQQTIRRPTTKSVSCDTWWRCQIDTSDTNLNLFVIASINFAFDRHDERYTQFLSVVLVCISGGHWCRWYCGVGSVAMKNENEWNIGFLVGEVICFNVATRRFGWISKIVVTEYETPRIRISYQPTVVAQYYTSEHISTLPFLSRGHSIQLKLAGLDFFETKRRKEKNFKLLPVYRFYVIWLSRQLVGW